MTEYIRTTGLLSAQEIDYLTELAPAVLLPAANVGGQDESTQEAMRRWQRYLQRAVRIGRLPLPLAQSSRS